LLVSRGILRRWWVLGRGIYPICDFHGAAPFKILVFVSYYTSLPYFDPFHNQAAAYSIDILYPSHITTLSHKPTATFPRPFIPPIIPFPTHIPHEPALHILPHPKKKNSQTSQNIKLAEINGVETSGHGCRANRGGGNGGMGGMEMRDAKCEGG